MRYGVLGVERCVLWRSPRKRRLKREYLNLQHCNLHVFVSQSTDSLLLDHEHGTKVRWICVKRKIEAGWETNAHCGAEGMQLLLNRRPG